MPHRTIPCAITLLLAAASGCDRQAGPSNPAEPRTTLITVAQAQQRALEEQLAGAKSQLALVQSSIAKTRVARHYPRQPENLIQRAPA